MGARPRNLALGHLLHGEFLALLGAVEKIEIEQLLVRKAGPATVPEEKRDFSHSFERTGGEERKRGREEERKRGREEERKRGREEERKRGREEERKRGREEERKRGREEERKRGREISLCAGRRIRRSECGRKNWPAPFEMTVGAWSATKSRPAPFEMTGGWRGARQDEGRTPGLISRRIL